MGFVDLDLAGQSGPVECRGYTVQCGGCGVGAGLHGIEFCGMEGGVSFQIDGQQVYPDGAAKLTYEVDGTGAVTEQMVVKNPECAAI